MLGGHLIFFNKHQFQAVEKFRRKQPVLGIWRNQNETTTVVGIWKKIRMKEPLVLVISKNLKELLGFMKEPEKKGWFVGNCLTLSNNEKGGIYHSRVFDFWRPARPHLQSRRGPPAEILFLLPRLYVVTSSHLVWERSRLILSAVKHWLSWQTFIRSSCLQVQSRRDWIKFGQVVGDQLL